MKSRLFSIVMLLTTLVLFYTSPMLAAEPAKVFLKQTGVAIEDQMAVEVVISNVTDLYGAEVRLRYDPLILEPVDTDPNQELIQVEPGPFLSPEQAFVVANQVDEANGVIAFAITLLNPTPPVTGQGVLLKVPFNVLQPNRSTLRVEHVKLVAHSLETIPSESQPFSFGTAPTLTEKEARIELAEQNNTTWIIAGGLLLAMGLSLMALIIIARKGPSTSRKRL